MQPEGNATMLWIPDGGSASPDLTTRVPFDRVSVLQVRGQFAAASLGAGRHCQVHVLHVLVMGRYSVLRKHKRGKGYIRSKNTSQASLKANCQDVSRGEGGGSKKRLFE